MHEQVQVACFNRLSRNNCGQPSMYSNLQPLLEFCLCHFQSCMEPAFNHVQPILPHMLSLPVPKFHIHHITNNNCKCKLDFGRKEAVKSKGGCIGKPAAAALPLRCQSHWTRGSRCRHAGRRQLGVTGGGTAEETGAKERVLTGGSSRRLMVS